jgi:hypothetical protein
MTIDGADSGEFRDMTPFSPSDSLECTGELSLPDALRILAAEGSPSAARGGLVSREVPLDGPENECD